MFYVAVCRCTVLNKIIRSPDQKMRKLPELFEHVGGISSGMPLYTSLRQKIRIIQ